ncbi:hypothetical protein PINS_up014002 [Pythium insidiosum]|nr:hypothetical protein PINS_up014002 [Pythium insidiosum]
MILRGGITSNCSSASPPSVEHKATPSRTWSSWETCVADATQWTKQLVDLLSLEPAPRALSTQERVLVATLEDAIVSALLHLLRDSADGNPAAEEPESSRHDILKRFFLELVVAPGVISRELAFSLLDRVALHSAMRVCRMQQSSPNETTPHALLFALFVEMMDRSVLIASASTPKRGASTENRWIERALSCLLLFSDRGCRQGFRDDRLLMIRPESIEFLLRRTTTSDARGAVVWKRTHDALVELVVTAMYAHHRQSVKPSLPQARVLPTNKSSPASSPRRPAAWSRVSVSDVARYGGIELFLSIFHTTQSERSRRVLLVLFFDVTLEQLKGASAAHAPAYEALLRCLQRWDVDQWLVVAPRLFIGARSAEFVTELHRAVENDLLEKQVQVFMTAFRAIAQLDEWFLRSSSLAAAIKLAASNRDVRVGDTMMSKIQQLLRSSREEERLKGVRWLAELLTYGADCGACGFFIGSGYGGSNNDNEHRTHLLLAHGAPAAEAKAASACPSQCAALRAAAQVQFWQLIRSTSSSDARLSAIWTLSLLTRRRLTEFTVCASCFAAA